MLEPCTIRRRSGYFPVNPDLSLEAKQRGFCLAAAASHHDVLDLLSTKCETDDGKPYNWLDLTRLYNAAGDGDSYTIVEFIQQGTQVDVPYVDGLTPLMRAIKSGRAPTV